MSDERVEMLSTLRRMLLSYAETSPQQEARAKAALVLVNDLLDKLVILRPTVALGIAHAIFTILQAVFDEHNNDDGIRACVTSASELMDVINKHIVLEMRGGNQ